MPLLKKTFANGYAFAGTLPEVREERGRGDREARDRGLLWRYVEMIGGQARRVRFTDSTGTSWTVRLSQRRETVLAIETRSADSRKVPILVFESGLMARALADFPETWATLSARDLEALCGRARLMRRNR